MKNLVRGLGLSAVALLAACESDNGSVNEPLFSNYQAYGGDEQTYAGTWLFVQNSSNAHEDGQNSAQTTQITKRSIVSITESIVTDDGDGDDDTSLLRLTMTTCGEAHPSIIDLKRTTSGGDTVVDTTALIDHAFEDGTTTVTGTTKWTFDGFNRATRETSVKSAFLAELSSEFVQVNAIKLAAVDESTEQTAILDIIQGDLHLNPSDFYQGQVTEDISYDVSCYAYTQEQVGGVLDGSKFSDSLNRIYVEGKQTDTPANIISLSMERDKANESRSVITYSDGTVQNYTFPGSAPNTTTPYRPSMFFLPQAVTAGIFERGEFDQEATPPGYIYNSIMQLNVKL